MEEMKYEVMEQLNELRKMVTNTIVDNPDKKYLIEKKEQLIQGIELIMRTIDPAFRGGPINLPD